MADEYIVGDEKKFKMGKLSKPTLWQGIIILLLLVSIVFSFGLANGLNMLKQQTAALTNTDMNNNAIVHNSIIGVSSSLSSSIENVNAQTSNLQTNLDNINRTITAIRRNQTVNQNMVGAIKNVNSSLVDLEVSVNQLPAVLRNYTNILTSIYLNHTGLESERIKINVSNYTVGPNQYYFGTMLDKFANHINFSSNESVTMDILTQQQFAEYVSNRSFSTVQTYVGSNQLFWFNGSEGCQDYVYVITGSTSTFQLRTNITAEYQPSNTPTGVCG